MSPISIITFYKFFPIRTERLPSLKDDLFNRAHDLNIKGLIIIAPEGVNSTIAGSPSSIALYKNFLMETLGQPDLVFKGSVSEENPFRRLKVDVRKDIVNLGKHTPLPEMNTEWHLSPSDWNAMLKNSDEDFLLIDVRNHYETILGKFKGADIPGLNSFGEFMDYVKRSNIPKDKKVLMYCTGGIRCEKASYAMKELGYDSVYQLQGGILRYLEEFPNQEYEGECFVFDERVAVGQDLKPSKKYTLCPHCGDPASIPIECNNCGTRAVVCDRCVRVEAYRTCSKNCRYHMERQASLQ